MVELKLSSASFELSPWILDFIIEKMDVIERLSEDKQVDVSLRFLKQRELFEVRAMVNCHGKQFHFLEKSRSFKSGLDEIITRIENELIERKRKGLNRHQRECLFFTEVA